MTATSSVPDIDGRRQELAQRIKARLAASSITVEDARDGLRDCFVSSYLGGVSEGLRNFDLQGDVNQVSRVIESMFRRRLRDKGGSWELPDTTTLLAVKDEIDHEMHIHELPAELRGVHDQVCNLLLAKADNTLPHHGNRSVVTSKASAGSSVAKSRPMAVSMPSSKAKVGPAEHAIRQSVTAYLEEMIASTGRGAEPDQLLADINGLRHLVNALQATITRQASH